MKEKLHDKTFKSFSERWKYFSGIHLLSAERLCKFAYNIELIEKPTKLDFLDYQAYIVASIISSVAAVEATINECIFDIIEEHPPSFVGAPEIDKTMRDKIVILDKYANLDRMSILDKYNIIYYSKHKDELDKGKEEYQNMALVIKLRNALVHFRSEKRISVNGQSFELHKFEKQLSSKKISESKFASEDSMYFPDRCLSYSMAKWSIESTKNFMKYALDGIVDSPRCLL